MLYKSLFSIAILGLSGVDARIYQDYKNNKAAAEAQQAAEEAVIEESKPMAVQKLEAFLEKSILKVDPAFEFDVPECECPCSDDITGTEGVIVTPTGPGLINICVPEDYLKIFIYFPDLFEMLFPQVPAVDFVCATSDDKTGCPDKLVIPLPLPELPDLPGFNKTEVP